MGIIKVYKRKKIKESGLENAKPRRGRPKGSKNKAKDPLSVEEPKFKKGRGRPKGSKNKVQKHTNLKKAYVKKIEADILKDSTDSTEPTTKKSKVPTEVLDQILFKIPAVPDPLIGTPKEVQKTLDNLAKQMQKDPSSNAIFNKIHLYMHTYLVNVVLRKFPFIKGSQTVDVYQETLIALRFKAIPNFKKNKGMSFLNFAKMCIRRHLITLLHASRNRNKDKTINFAISLDSTPNGDDDNGSNTLANTIGDTKLSHDKAYERSEAFVQTKKTLSKSLSEFERCVLDEYLADASYKEIADIISIKFNENHNAKSIDNALLRIRKKASHLKKYCKDEDMPIFINRNENL